MVGLHMVLEVFTGFPGLTKHKVVVNSRRLEYIIGDTSLVTERQFDKFGTNLQEGLPVFLFLQQEEYIESDHDNVCLNLVKVNIAQPLLVAGHNYIQ